MNIHLIAVGTRMPTWVQDGFSEYAKRLPHECSLKLIEIEASKRQKNAAISDLKKREAEKILSAIPSQSLVIALDVKGNSWSTEQLANNIQHWMNEYKNIALLIGGPDGLDDSCLSRAQQKWSLSALTFPHPLVRIIIAEQIYRAHSLLKGHPYHRE